QDPGRQSLSCLYPISRGQYSGQGRQRYPKSQHDVDLGGLQYLQSDIEGQRRRVAAKIRRRRAQGCRLLPRSQRQSGTSDQRDRRGGHGRVIDLLTGVLEYWSHGALVNPLLHYSTTPLLQIPRHESYQPPNRSQAASQTQQRNSLQELLPRKDLYYRAHRFSSEKKLGLKANQQRR